MKHRKADIIGHEFFFLRVTHSHDMKKSEKNKQLFRKWLFIMFVCSCIVMGGTAFADNAKVLILHSYHQEYPWTNNQNKGFIETLTAGYPAGNITFSTEYLDTKRVGFSEEYQEFFFQYLKIKFAHYSPAVIFCSDDNALHFLMEYKGRLFGDVPVVFSGVNDLDIEKKLNRQQYTGIFEKKEIIPNLAFLKKMNLPLGNIIFLGDGSSTDQAIKQKIQSDIASQFPDLRYTMLTNSKLSYLIDHLKSHKEGVIFLTTIGGISDEEGVVLPLKKIIESIADAGNFTIISMEDVYLEEGVLGGYVTSGISQGKEAANLTMKILQGNSPLSVPLVKESPNEFMFNYTRMKELGLRSSLLPEKSIILNRPRSFYGEYKYRIWSGISFLIFQTIIIFVLLQNIQKRKNAETSLQNAHDELELRIVQRTRELGESEAKFRSIIESLPMGVHVWELRPDGKLIFSAYNPSADRILHTDHTQFLGREISDAFPSLAETVVPQKYREICEKGIPWQTEQLDYKDEVIKGAFEVHAFQISPGKMAALFRDITDKLQNEENVHRLERQVQKAEHLESLGLLAGGIAHDFNNILMATLGNLSLARLSLLPESRASLLIREAEKASLRARDLTQQLLTFSKGGEPIKETSSISEVVAESASFVLRGSNIACQFNLPKDLWLVDIDKGQMSQVIQNIVINAKHAMPSGGIISVTGQNIDDIRKENVPLPISNRYTKITITDQGIGIPKNVIDKIFEPYFSTKQEGSGLGLAITYSIIAKHKGYIGVHSEIGIGTSFFIYLPASHQDMILSSETTSAPAVKKLRILLMDDEESIRDLTKEMLTALGHEVLLAVDGREAIDTYTTAEKPIDIVIMDLTIPGGMGGKEAVQEILKVDKNAKVIVSSGYSVDPIMANHKSYGFCAAIAKPYRFQELSILICRVLDS